MQADTERDLATGLGGRLAHSGDLFGDLRRRLAPCQILVNEADGEVDRRIRRPAEIYGRFWRLHGRQHELGIVRLDILAIEMRVAGLDQIVEDLEEFGGVIVALVMRQENTVAGQFLRAATDHDVEQQAAIRHAVERRGKTGIIGRRRRAGTDGDEEFQLLRHRRQIGG